MNSKRNSIILFGLALTIRLLVSWYWQFDGLYGQDAYAYLNQAGAIYTYLPQGHLPPTDFFWPNGYPLLIAGAMLLEGPTAQAGQLVALLCGAALAPLVYLLSIELWAGDKHSTKPPPELAGLIAGLIIAVSGQAILSSVVIMADMPALFWATLSAWLIARAVRNEQLQKISPTPLLPCSPAPLLPYSPALHLIAAGASLGLAITTRWLYALLLPTFGLYLWYSLRRPWRLMAAAMVGGLVTLTPQLWLTLQTPAGLTHSWLTGWQPANFFQREFFNVDGHFSYPLPNAIFYAQPAGHPAFIFPLLGLAALWGVWQLIRTRQEGPLILLLGWAGAVYLFLAGIPYQNLRFGLTLYPPLAILAGYGVYLVVNRTPFQKTIQIGLLLSLVGMLAWAYPMLNNFLTTQNHSKQIALRVEQALPPQATLIAFGLTLTLQHDTRLHTLELFHLSQGDLATLTQSDGPLYLLVDPPNLESQWRGQKPQLHYRWLTEHTILTKLDQFSPYQLYKISAKERQDADE